MDIHINIPRVVCKCACIHDVEQVARANFVFYVITKKGMNKNDVRTAERAALVT